MRITPPMVTETRFKWYQNDCKKTLVPMVKCMMSLDDYSARCSSTSS